MKRIDRRALFTSGAAAALLAAAGIAPEARPREGGRLRLAVPRDDGSMERVFRGAVFDTLTEVGPDGVLTGELASGWQGSADARLWRIELREDVAFHDGRRMRAEDVVASLQQRADVLGPLDVEIEGPERLLIVLPEGDPDLPFRLANPKLFIAPGGAVDGPLNQAIGTGRYAVVRAEEDRHFLGRRVTPDYKAGRAGWADEVEVVVLPDAGVRAEALRDGYVDVAALPLPQGLIGQGEFAYHPSLDDMALAASRKVGIPQVVGSAAPFDDGRIAERWWIA